MKDDTKTKFQGTLDLLNKGLSAAITEVVGNAIFTGAEENSKSRTKFSDYHGRNDRRHRSPDNKKPRTGDSSTNDSGKEKDTPICNGCGRWISSSHTQDNCSYIKNRREGYNKDFNKTPWPESEAHRALKEKILAKNPDAKARSSYPHRPDPFRIETIRTPKV